ncbi:hypothetical protein BGZ46_007254 [Entomortierella lignicola]|nr:hypothetical protein BGZ46_007254 [Entomortierella lignicola]
MNSAGGFISFHDLSPDIRFLWASPSVFQALGYNQDEIVGMNSYDLVLPDGAGTTHESVKENVKNDLVATQIVNKLRHKDGHIIPYVHCFSTCYDFIASVSTIIDTSAETLQSFRKHSIAMTRMVNSKKLELERMKRHHEAFAANTWNYQALEPELRVCFILNRYTRNLVILYASSACDRLLHVDPDEITGKPFLLFIRSDDLAPFVDQMTIVKGTTAVVHMRFWFQPPNLWHETPLEAIFTGSVDGILVVMRRCKPFHRKQLIEGGYQNEEPTWGTGDSTCPEYSTNGTSPTYSSSTGSSKSSYDEFGFSRWERSLEAHRVDVNKIQIVEIDEKGARPIDLPENDPSLVRENTASLAPLFKEMVIQDYQYDDQDDSSGVDELTEPR